MKKFGCNNEIVTSIKEFNITEMKLFYSFVYHYKMQRDLINMGTREMEIPARKLLEVLEGYNLVRSKVEDILKEMPSKIQFMEIDGTRQGYISIYDTLSYDSKFDVYEITFSEFFTELLDKREEFANLYLDEIKKISTKYGIRMYELLKRYENQKFYLMKKDTFYRYFNIPASYKSGEINRTVIRKSIKEVESITGASISCTPVKDGHKVTHYKFIFKKRTKKEND